MSRYQRDQGVNEVQQQKLQKTAPNKQQQPAPTKGQQQQQQQTGGRGEPARGGTQGKQGANKAAAPSVNDRGGRGGNQQQQQQQGKTGGKQTTGTSMQQAASGNRRQQNEKDAYTPRGGTGNDNPDEQPFDEKSELEYQESVKKEEMENRTKEYYDHIQQQMIVDQLKKATRMRHRQHLERLIQKFEDLQIPDHDDDLDAARRMVDVLDCRDRLLVAIRQRLEARMREVLQDIEDRGYVTYLQPEVQQAEHVLFVLAKADERANKAVPSLAAGTLSEVRAYKHPPPHVHKVIQAVLLLLGEHEDRTEDWKECQRLCSPQGENSISRRIYNFTIENLHPEIVARVKQILSKVNLSQMQETSSGITAYYVWAKGTVDEYEQENNTEGIQPANKGRQRELLPDSPLASPRKWNTVGDRTPANSKSKPN